MISTQQRDTVKSARRRSDGFTLIEVMVALMVVALIATIGVKGFRTVTKSNLREGTAHMSGAIRYLFDRASVTGKYHRLVIDLNDGKYWAEVWDDRFYAPNQAESEADRQKREEKEAAADADERKRQERQQSLYGNSSSSSAALDQLRHVEAGGGRVSSQACPLRGVQGDGPQAGEARASCASRASTRRA